MKILKIIHWFLRIIDLEHWKHTYMHFSVIKCGIGGVIETSIWEKGGCPPVLEWYSLTLGWYRQYNHKVRQCWCTFLTLLIKTIKMVYVWNCHRGRVFHWPMENAVFISLETIAHTSWIFTTATTEEIVKQYRQKNICSHCQSYQ